MFVNSSVVTTFLEIKADTFKLLFLYKRPVPRCEVNELIAIVVDFRSVGATALYKQVYFSKQRSEAMLRGRRFRVGIVS